MRETITLAGGCFWCLEAVFQQVRGVESVVSGYMGGYVDQPEYGQVCEGHTGHAEVVQIVFDSSVITTAELLDIFFAIHDPYTLNRQGNDVGTQYRSAIFASNPEQLIAAENKIAALAQQSADAIVTQVLMAAEFWPAEIDHHNYYRLHSNQPYCRAIIEPKLKKFMRDFVEKVR
ncbi:peptide-methionine (S)-S-oxide reductase MsrA [Deefgea salmonis]|uniref:Peptide methionine sulfoxide reductase MsrA n=1 Tax=Deefgea salmonis TaxID=2875502 RepID=A0ABS8BH36_9NEIS|nr:peptide-methionine (S)-S-oxide reductase MsrA [Deefgea salmonis]MCB5195008.1 peptide-methionine (S)-S-oxide reductase MsrA [Deefgea salmonis]